MWVILYLSRERQHFKNTLVYIRRNKAKNVGRKKFFGFFRNILLIFLIDFWLSLIEILRMQLDFFVWFLELFSILLFFYREKKFWWRGSQFLLFLYTCRFFLLFLQIIHVESKIQLRLPIILVAVNAFVGVSDVKEKILFMVFLK